MASEMTKQLSGVSSRRELFPASCPNTDCEECNDRAEQLTDQFLSDPANTQVDLTTGEWIFTAGATDRLALSWHRQLEFTVAFCVTINEFDERVVSVEPTTGGLIHDAEEGAWDGQDWVTDYDSRLSGLALSAVTSKVQEHTTKGNSLA